MRIGANLVVRSSRMVKRVTGSDVTGIVVVGNSTTGVLVLQENPGEAQSLYVVFVTNKWNHANFMQSYKLIVFHI